MMENASAAPESRVAELGVCRLLDAIQAFFIILQPQGHTHMFNVFNRSRPRYPTIRQALVVTGLTAAADPARVAVVEKHGQYSGRRVNFFRAFEPGHHDVLLGSGHVEHEGLVVVDSRPVPEGIAPAREPANRADHADDERLVFWDAAAARSSETTLSAPAATWLHARSTPIASIRG